MTEYQIVCKDLKDNGSINKVGLANPGEKYAKFAKTPKEINDMIDEGTKCFFTDEKGDVAEVEDTRSHFNSQISGLTIAAEDASCSYNRIEVGAKSLSWGVMAQAVLTAYWPTPNLYQYAEQEVDFATGYNWEVESNACDIWNDKDIEWLANHEFGHALSLGHHSGTDHSMMKDSCTSKYSAIQSVDDSALEARY